MLVWFLISIGGSQYSFCQTIKTISVEFTREYRESNSKEIIKGKIYYKAPFKTVIKIKYPINQWMILEDKEMIIYYPDDKKAFHIISSVNPFSMLFFKAFKFLKFTKSSFLLIYLRFISIIFLIL